MRAIRSSCGDRCAIRGEKVAVICSAHVNAVGIALSLREIGWKGQIICLKINDAGPAVADRWPDLCECWRLTLSAPEEILSVVGKRIPGETLGAVFFTDERFLPTFCRYQGHDVLRQARFRVGSSSRLDDVIDRRKFYEFVSEQGLARVPTMAPSCENPWKIFGKQFHIRVWRSWMGLKKLPRGGRIGTKSELRDWFQRCHDEGLGLDEWGYQELLSTIPEHNVSVCGWHDGGFRYYLMTRKLRATKDYGWLIETTDNFPELKTSTSAILSALQYCGPFEMEFVLDPKKREFKVIELNPRFWMQHRLAAILGGNCLVRRYLELDVSSEVSVPQKNKRFWLETDLALEALLSRHVFAVLPYLSKGVWACPVLSSLGYILRRRIQRAREWCRAVLWLLLRRVFRASRMGGRRDTMQQESTKELRSIGP